MERMGVWKVENVRVGGARERESGDVRWERGIFISRNTEYGS